MTPKNRAPSSFVEENTAGGDTANLSGMSDPDYESPTDPFDTYDEVVVHEGVSIQHPLQDEDINDAKSFD